MSHILLSYDEAAEYLNEVAETIPPAVFTHLNGGISLVNHTLPSPHSNDGSLYILGQYHFDPNGLGRYISIYYGSFVRLYGHAGIASQKEALRKVLFHELTHHLEHMAGVRDLEEVDKIQIQQYLNRHNKD